MTDTEFKNLKNDAYGLLFDIKRSIMYHELRAAFLGAVSDWLCIGSLISIFVSSAAWFYFGSILFISIMMLLFAKWIDDKAEEHLALRKAFMVLEKDILIGPSPTYENKWVEYKARRMNIEQNEPPVYFALNNLCYNITLIENGFTINSEYYIPMTKWQKLTCQWYKWPGIIAPCK